MAPSFRVRKRAPPPEYTSRQLLEERLALESERRHRFHDRVNQHQEVLRTKHNEALAAASRRSKLLRSRTDYLQKLLDMQHEREVEEMEAAQREIIIKAEAQERARKLEIKRRMQEDVDRRLKEEQAISSMDHHIAARQADLGALASTRNVVQNKLEEQAKPTQPQQPTDSLAAPSSKAQGKQPITFPASGTASKSAPRPSGVVVDQSFLEAEHMKYLTLHQRLKDMRRDIKEKIESIPSFSDLVADRREIRKFVGQMTTNPEANKSKRQKILQKLVHARNNRPEVMYNIDLFMVHPTSGVSPEPNTQISGALIFLLNHVVKYAINAMEQNSYNTLVNGVDQFGVMLAWIFSIPELQINGNSLVDILLAKFHRSCPILFGISAPSESTHSGRKRIGWIGSKEEGWVPVETQYDRFYAMGASFSSITLRKFSSSMSPALQRWRWWLAISNIVNIPGEKALPSHFIIVKGMIFHYGPSIVDHFGAYGVSLLRRITGEWSGKSKLSEAKHLNTVRMLLRKDNPQLKV